MSQYTRNNVPSKPTRNTSKAEARFGKGLLAWTPTPCTAPGFTHPSAPDEAWWAATSAEFRGGEGWLDDAAADQMAFERELEDRYLRSCELFERCAACGQSLEGGAPTNSLCLRCTEVLASVDAVGRGHCVICGVLAYVEEDTGACVTCDLNFADRCSTGNRGY